MSSDRDRARAGVRSWVRRSGAALRTASPYGILALLAASAVAPVAGAALGATGEVGAVLGQLGGMGSNYLADAVAGTAQRLHGTDPSPDRWRDELAAELRDRLEAGDERAAALRDEVTAVLHAVDAVDVALRDADADLRAHLVTGFAALGDGVGRLHQLGRDALRVLDDLHRQLVAQTQAQHQQTDLLRQSLVLIAGLRQDVTRPVAAPQPRGGGAGPCPYPGMASFEAEQARWFRGRETLVADLLVRMEEQALGGPPLVVVGVSGAGKSSLLRAGLLPAMGLAEASGSWPWLVLTPGAAPLAQLVDRTAALAGTDPAAELTAVRADPAAFGALAGRAGGSGRLVILVDQFEELFTQCADPAERTAFVAALAAAAPALLAVAVRADFYPQCTELPELVPMLAAGQVVCGPMSSADLRRAITEPAAIAGLRLEPGLADLLLAGLGPGALPFLAHALRATWEHRDGDTLTVAGYRATGGIRRAVADTAETVYLDRDEAGRAALRRAVLDLVTIVDDRPVRRRAARADADLDALRPLIAARLVTAAEDTVEISHEALLDGWPRLAGWLAEAREDILLRQRVARAAAEWAADGEDPDALLRGTRLDAARGWTGLAEGQRRFVAASVAAEAARERGRRRGVRRLRRLAAGLGVALLLAVTGGVVVLRQRADAVAAERRATSRQLAVESRGLHYTDPAASARKALAAWQAAPTTEARTAVLMAQHTNVLGRLGSEPGGAKVAVSPDGTRVAVGFGDGRIQLWDARTRQRVGSDLQAAIGDLASLNFSPDGRFLAAGSIARSFTGLRVWTQPDAGRPLVLPGLGAATWSADGASVLAVGRDPDSGRIRLNSWDPGTGRLAGAIDAGVAGTLDLAASPDGRYLAMVDPEGSRVVRRSDGSRVADLGADLWQLGFGADGTLFGVDRNNRVRAWSAASGWRARVLNDEPGSDAGFYPAVTRDGTVIVGGTEAGLVHRFTTGGPRLPVDGVAGVPFGIALSADEHLMAIITPTEAPQLLRLGVDALPHPNLVHHVAFDPTGTRLATGSTDDLIRIWDTRTSRSLPPLDVPGDAGPLGLTYGPDGSLAASYEDGRIVIFHPDGRVRGTLRLDARDYPAVPRFSPDGALLSVIGTARDIHRRPGSEVQKRDDPDLYLWDARTLTERGRIRIPGQVGIGHAWTPDGATLILTANRYHETLSGARRSAGGVTQDSFVWRYRVAGLAPVGSRLVAGDGVDEVAVSPDGITVAVASGRSAQLLRVDGLTPAGTLGTHSARVQRVAFSPDGRMLATATDTRDDLVRLWDTRTGESVAELRADSNQRGEIAFSPDGRTLAAGSNDWTARLWHLDPADSAGRVCAILGAACR